MGFFLMMPYFICRRHRLTRSRAWIWLVVGIVAGSVMGWARMVQGGHFLTDVMWSGGMTYACGWLADRLLHPAKAAQRAAIPARLGRAFRTLTARAAPQPRPQK
jgi:membrane-associated phospholipid phosphatase